MKSFLRSIWSSATGKRGISFYFSLACLVCMTISLILYNTTGVTTFTPELSGKVLALMYACIIVSALVCVFEIKIAKYALYMLCLAAWLEHLLSESFFISNVFVGIDGNSFSAEFICAVVFGLLGWATALVSAILQKDGAGNDAERPVPATANAED